MADSGAPDLTKLNASRMYDLTGLVAVVTGQSASTLLTRPRHEHEPRRPIHDPCHRGIRTKQADRAPPIGGASGIGLMISSVLLANHATVYIVDLDEKQTEAIADRYSKLAQDSGSRGKMVGVQGDCSSKVGSGFAYERSARKVDHSPCRMPPNALPRQLHNANPTSLSCSTMLESWAGRPSLRKNRPETRSKNRTRP